VYKKSVSGETFLLYDSFEENVDNKQILLFSTLKNLELLQNNNNNYWSPDDTFSCTPKLFTRLYTIRSIIDTNAIPLIYVILPDKSKDTYRRMFVTLNSIKYNLNSKHFILDYEKAAINGVVHVYPEAQVKGCFFT